MRKKKTNKRMKQVRSFNMRLIGFFALVVGLVLSATTGSAIDLIEMAGINVTDSAEYIAHGVSWAGVPLMVTIKGVSGIADGTLFDVTKGFEGYKQAKGITEAAYKELKPADMAKLHTEYINWTMKAASEHAERTDEETKEALETLKTELATMLNLAVKNNQEALKDMSRQFTEMVESAKATATSPENFQDKMKTIYDEKEEEFKNALSGNRDTVKMVIEKAVATQAYGDITDGSDFAQMRTGVTDIAVRRPRIRNLFSTIPLSTEVYKYTEQATVIRDAKNVATCAVVASTTKETLIVREMTTRVVKDMMNFCRTFVSDYPFMQSRINKLINESVALKVDDQLLKGTGAGLETFSIDSYASEFSATNVILPMNDGINGVIQDGNFIDLLLGMSRQISLLGEQEAFQPNAVFVNLADWFLLIESKKDANNNYLDGRVINVNGVPSVGGMAVLPLYNVALNTCYVVDTTKAEVLDRMKIEIEIAFQNGSNWENEIATIKGLERVNLWCPVNYQNAFMKCSDITTAIAAITKP